MAKWHQLLHDVIEKLDLCKIEYHGIFCAEDMLPGINTTFYVEYSKKAHILALNAWNLFFSFVLEQMNFEYIIKKL